MESVTFFRIIKTGAVNFWRNIRLSAAATMVMTVTLLIFGILFLMFAVTNYSIKNTQNVVSISASFKIGLDEAQITRIKGELEKDTRIKQIVYTSQEEALAKFKERHAGDADITGALNELTENPLQANLNIQTFELEQYPGVAEELNKSAYKDFITKVNFDDNRVVIERLTKILNFIITFGIGLVVVLSTIAILVIFNTITLTIYNRKEEVEIMRLVGATNWYIRGPFLAESLMYAICATILTGLLFVPIFTQILPKIAQYVNPQLTVFSTNLFNYWYLMLLVFIISILLATISTMLAIRKYLKT